MSSVSLDRWSTRRNRALEFLRENGLSGAVATLREAGLVNAAAFLYKHARYSMCIYLGKRWDRRWGVDTCGHIDIENLEVSGPNRAFGFASVSTSPGTFHFFRRFFPRRLEDYSFVDMGCGKGRPMLLAAGLEFSRVFGVDFAGHVCSVAQKNLTMRVGSTKPWSVAHADATTYDLPLTPLVLYFGNPFSRELWGAMLENIRRSFHLHPRPIHLILAGSMEEPVRENSAFISGHGMFHQTATGRAPYFLDTYLPFFYSVFELGPGIAQPVN